MAAGRREGARVSEDGLCGFQPSGSRGSGTRPTQSAFCKPSKPSLTDERDLFGSDSDHGTNFSLQDELKALESYVKNVSVLTSELTYKIDSQTENKFTKGERGSLGLHMHTTIYKITNKALLYSTGNYIQYSVITYKGKKGKRYLYIYMSVCVCVRVCVYIYIDIYIYVCIPETDTTLYINYVSITKQIVFSR